MADSGNPTPGSQGAAQTSGVVQGCVTKMAAVKPKAPEQPVRH